MKLTNTINKLTYIKFDKLNYIFILWNYSMFIVYDILNVFAVNYIFLFAYFYEGGLFKVQLNLRFNGWKSTEDFI